MSAYIGRAGSLLVQLLCAWAVAGPVTLRQNIGIAFGRLAICCPTQVTCVCLVFACVLIYVWCSIGLCNTFVYGIISILKQHVVNKPQ